MDDLISRSEAIRIASGYCHWTNIPEELAKLPSVNPKPCEDAISRKQILDAFGLSEKTRKYGGDHSGYNTMMLYEIQEVIEGLSSVSTEKTGRWYLYEMFANGETILECSVCHNKHDKPWKYCPNCGARMKGVEE